MAGGGPGGVDVGEEEEGTLWGEKLVGYILAGEIRPVRWAREGLTGGGGGFKALGDMRGTLEVTLWRGDNKPDRDRGNLPPG